MDASQAAEAVVPGDWLWQDVDSPSAFPGGRALNLSGEEHCLNPQLPVNYVVGSCQNDAFVAVRTSMAAATGTVGLTSHGDLLLFSAQWQEHSTQGMPKRAS